MNKRELLYELLTASPSRQLEGKLRLLLESDIDSALYSTSVIDVLFFWLYRQRCPTKKTKNLLTEYLILHGLKISLPPSRQFLLKNFAVRVGVGVLNVEDESNGLIEDSITDYYTFSRALIADVDVRQGQLNREEIARDACFYLFKCDFISAFHALQCLRALRKESRFGKRIAEFTSRAEIYLSEILKLYPSPILLWEKELLQDLTQKLS